MPRSGYDVTSLLKGCPGRDVADDAQHKRPGGETPRAGSPPNQVRPRDDAQGRGISRPVDPTKLAGSLAQSQGYQNPNAYGGVFDGYHIDPLMLMMPSRGSYATNRLSAEATSQHRGSQGTQLASIPPNADLTSPRPSFQRPVKPEVQKQTQSSNTGKNSKKASEASKAVEPPKSEETQRTKLPPVRACNPVSRVQQKRGVLKNPRPAPQTKPPTYGLPPPPTPQARPNAANTPASQGRGRAQGYYNTLDLSTP